MATDMSDEASASVEALQGLGESTADRLKKAGQGAAASRELTVSTLVHLLGLPSMAQMAAMESSVDLMARKMQTISAQLEKISSELQALSADNSSERIDFQLNEIRAILKRAVVTTGGAKSPAEPSTKSSTRSARIIESEPPAEAAANPEPCALSDFDNPDDASFQQAEAQKVREEMAAKIKE